MARNLSMIVILAIAAFVGLSVMFRFGGGAGMTLIPAQGLSPSNDAGASAPTDLPEGSPVKMSDLGVTDDLLTGKVIAPKLENATLKAELGRAAWKVLHTMVARFPEKPEEDDSLALKTYIQLFARLYPCGDCARHFQGLLKKYPPQTSGRNAAAGWACFVHNEVNTRLKKPIFDCKNIGDFYDCGCGDEDKKKKEAAAAAAGKEGGVEELKKDDDHSSG